jgi:hypothetical protein
MKEYGSSYHGRNRKRNERAKVRSVRWHGPRFVKGRRSSRLTAVWTVRARKSAVSEVTV